MKIPKPHRNDLEKTLAEFFHLKGFTLHKCCTEGNDGQDHMVGGLCLTPEPDGNVMVGWALNSRHNLLDHHADGTEFHADLLVVLRKALERADFPTEPGPMNTSVRVLSTTVPDRIGQEIPV